MACAMQWLRSSESSGALMSLSGLLLNSDVQPHGYREVPPDAVYPHLAALRLVDVREPHEYVGPLGHVPGSELFPLSTVAEAAPSWDLEQPVLIICRSGARSASAAALLCGMGFRQVFNLTGGMIAWDANDLPRRFMR
jgi:rhodanese-related sulfurtransferase